MSASGVGSLCETCQHIPFDKIFNSLEGIFDKTGRFVAYLATDRVYFQSCSFCRLIQSFLDDYSDSYQRGVLDYQLRAFSSLRNLNEVIYSSISEQFQVHDTVILGIVPTKLTNFGLEGRVKLPDFLENVGYIARLSPLRSNASVGFWGRQVPDHVDFGHLRSIMDFCAENHPPSCHLPIQIDNGIFPSFKVIDCSIGQIVTIPDARCTYAALSYVWSGAQPLENDRDITAAAREQPHGIWGLTKIPRVILDAMTATKKLGIEYLWYKISDLSNSPLADLSKGGSVLHR